MFDTLLAAVASRQGGNGMTTLEVTLDLPDRMAREAQAAGLLTPNALRAMLKDAMRRRAAEDLLAGAARGSLARARPLSNTETTASARGFKAPLTQMRICVLRGSSWKSWMLCDMALRSYQRRMGPPARVAAHRVASERIGSTWHTDRHTRARVSVWVTGTK